MALTPVDIRHIRLRKALFGYQAKQTDDLLADIVNSFEDVWRDRADLADKIEQLGTELVRYRELEQLLRTTLISAERASQQMTDQTRRETESVLSEARAEAREILREAMAERERLNAEINRIRAQLVAVLGTIGGESLAEESASKESTLETPPASPVVAAPPAQTAPPQASPVAPPAQPVAPAQWPAPTAQPPPPRPAGKPGEPATGQAMAGMVANGVAAPAPR
ncbi:MAG: DivIVA domain-containing protein [Gaiellaceae bacterium]|jgi:cell division initiation protein